MTTNTANPELRRRKVDLVHLRNLTAAEPATSTGRVMWIWPEIEASLAAGKKLREVWEAVNHDGLSIPYPQFRVYVSRVRRRMQIQRLPDRKSAPQTVVHSQAEPSPSADPFSNLRTQRDKKSSSGFHYDPFSIQKQLID